jgi:hypothetical protein
MALDYKYFRPIRIAGICFVIFGVLCVLIYLSLLKDLNFDSTFRIFVLINIFWYLLMGLGILFQKIWGYYLLKIFSYALVISFPMGTYFGVKSLRYLREHNIKSYFAKQAIDI